jgi:hypothetical protein
MTVKRGWFTAFTLLIAVVFTPLSASLVWASPTSGDMSIPASMSLYKDKEVLQTTVLDKSELHYYDTQTGRWEYSSYFDKVANEYPVHDTVKAHQLLRLRIKKAQMPDDVRISSYR